jgi:hypothetical protein
MIEDSKLAQPRYNGLVHGVKLMVREEGYRGIYRGVGPVVSRSTPCTGSSATLPTASGGYDLLQSA